MALCAVQAVLFLILLNVLLVLGAAHSAALLLAWLGSAPALLVVLAVALPTGRSPRPA